MATIAVDPQRLAECAGHFAAVQGEVVRAAGAATAGLAGSGGMAGNDPAGVIWSDAYDPAALRLVSLAADLADRMGAQIYALNESAAAYQATESWFGGSSPDTGIVPAQAHAQDAVRTLPQARGGLPFASHDPVVQAVMSLIGTVWPNGDASQLRAASARWSAMACTLDAARSMSLASAAGSLDGMSSPAVSAACARTHELDGAVGELSSGANELSSACSQLAAHIDETHQAAQREIQDLLVDTAITAAVSAALSFATFGAGALVGGAAATLRVAATAGRLSAWFQRLAAMAQAAARKIARLGDALEALVGRMARWATGRLPRPLRRLPDIAGKATDHWLLRLATEGPAAALGKVLEKPAAALGGRLGETAARRALVLAWRTEAPGVRAALVRTAVSSDVSPRGASRHGPSSSGISPGGIAPGRDSQGRAASVPGATTHPSTGAERIVARAMERGQNERVASLVGKPQDAVTATGQNLMQGAAAEPAGVDETDGDIAPVEAAAPGPRWAVDLRLPEDLGLRLEVPKIIDFTHSFELHLDDRSVTGPVGIETGVRLPGAAGKLIDSGLAVARAADLEDNWWKEHLDAAAALRPGPG